MRQQKKFTVKKISNHNSKTSKIMKSGFEKFYRAIYYLSH